MHQIAPFPVPLPLASPTVAPPVQYQPIPIPTAHSPAIIPSSSSIPSALSQQVVRLPEVHTIKKAIEQYKDGIVKEVRDAAAPGASRNTSSRRTRLFNIYKDDFGENMDRMLQFFTKPDGEFSEKGKRRDKPANQYTPTELADKLLPSMKKVIAEEKKKECYLDNGVFSEELWKERWGNRNRWEVCRYLQQGSD